MTLLVGSEILVRRKTAETSFRPHEPLVSKEG